MTHLYYCIDTKNFIPLSNPKFEENRCKWKMQIGKKQRVHSFYIAVSDQ
jgi:hypothetical protein